MHPMVLFKGGWSTMLYKYSNHLIYFILFHHSTMVPQLYFFCKIIKCNKTNKQTSKKALIWLGLSGWMGTFQTLRKAGQQVKPAKHQGQAKLGPARVLFSPLRRSQNKQPMAGYLLERKHYVSHTVFIQHESTFGDTFSF